MAQPAADPHQALLDLLLKRARARGSVTLEGNRESWAILDWTPGEGFVHRGGDPLAGGEDFHEPISEAHAARLLLALCRSRASVFGAQGLDDAALLEWARRNPFLF